MNRKNLRVTRELVSLCLNPAESRLPPGEKDWGELLSLALYHGVAPLLWVAVRDRKLPASVHARLAALYTANLVRNRKLKAEQENVLTTFAAQDIPSWPLKGIYLSEVLYQDLGARQAADIDILIRPQDLEKADRILTELSYRRTVEDELAQFRRSPELLYGKPAGSALEFSLDLHQRLLPYGDRDPLAERVWRSGMTPENLLLYLCANQVGHRFARFKHALDIKLLLDQTADKLDWDSVVEGARELDLVPGIYYSLESVRELAAAPVSGPVLAALRPGWFERKLARWALGGDPLAGLAAGPRLEGPYGAFALLACTRPGGARLRQLWRLLFPPVAYVRQQYGARPQQATLPLYLDRLWRKLFAAARGLVRAEF